jgi:hypothetical protein
MPVEGLQTRPYVGCLSHHLSLELAALLRLHEVSHFLGTDFCIVDVEGVPYGVLVDEVKHLHPLDVVLLVDEEVEFLPLLCDHVEARAFVDEVAEGLQDADVHPQLVACARLGPLAALEDLAEELGHVGLGVVDALEAQTQVHLLADLAQTD